MVSEVNAADDIAQMVADSAAGIFERHGALSSHAVREEAGNGIWLTDAWADLEEAGFTLSMLSEGAGGVGLVHAMSIARLAAAYVLPAPLGEAMAANWLLEQSGLAPASDAVTFTDGMLATMPSPEGWHVSGVLKAVPWARSCSVVAVALHGDTPYLVRLDKGQFSVVEGTNMAGEPRDDCVVDTIVPADLASPLPKNVAFSGVRRLGAALRTNQLAGAMAAVVAMTVQYARDRKQFGRPIADFQAVQQLLAVMAAQSAAARVAADLAAEAVAENLEARAIAVGKARAGEAAGIVAAMAHQAHGAMGFTREYPLHLLTRRLWSWRDEFGGEAEWAIALGRSLASAGRDDFWRELTVI